MSERDDYRRVVEKKLETLEARIGLWKAEAQEAGADARLALGATIRDAQDNLAEGRARLNTLVEAGDDEWEELKDQLESIGDRIKGTLDEVFSNDHDKPRRG